jgi:hypothetical protein
MEIILQLRDYFQAFAQQTASDLMSAPIELAGDWGRMFPRAVKLVVGRIR